MRERGLKYDCPSYMPQWQQVAPHAGAWIEIPWSTMVVRWRWSLPMRERGLKFRRIAVDDEHVASLPMRERGLKSGLDELHILRAQSLPMRERGLKSDGWADTAASWRRSPCGSVD